MVGNERDSQPPLYKYFYTTYILELYGSSSEWST